MAALFDPISIGDLRLPNRIFMAPLTRGRANRDHVPTALMERYYAQRASAGLIITEATGISRQGLGWPFAPGIWSAKQVEGWKRVTNAIHVAGGHVFLQLWHMGRMVHPDFLAGKSAVSSSATIGPGEVHTFSGKQPLARARELAIAEIPGLIEQYRGAARAAVEAGFDGVQLHAANGYLIDQFLRDSCNFRNDAYGGPPENRVRLLREVTEAIADEIGPSRTAVRLSPNGMSQGAIDSNPEALFACAAKVLEPVGIAFLELREPRPDSTFRSGGDQPRQSPNIRQHYRGPLVLNSDYDFSRAQTDLTAGRADAISFGRMFLANPDLPRRFLEGAAINPCEVETWYTQGPQGYTDYPALPSA